MSKTFALFYRFFFATFFLISCSTDETGNGTDDSSEPLTGIAVTTTEIISLEVNTPLSAEEYQGTLGNRDVSLVKVDENHLMVMVPADMEEGISTLKVLDLDIEEHYDVSELKLNGTATETFNNLFSNVTNELNSFENSTDSEYASNYWMQVKSAFENASAEEQLRAAQYYQANREMLDNFLTDDYTRQSESDLSILSKHKLAVLAFGAGVTVAILSPDPITKAIAAGVAIIAWKKAKGYLSYLAEKKLKKINFIIDDLESELSRQQVERLEFTHDVSESLSLNLKQRTISSEDQSDTNENLGIFFDGFNLFNEVLRKLNNVISYVNENLFLSDMDTVDDASLTDDSPSSIAVNSNIFEKLEFSVGSDKIEIAEIAYQDGLKLKLTIKDTENLNQDYIDTELNYSYSDDFNDFSGSFDIRVNKDVYNYKLQIGNYRSNYESIEVLETLSIGDAFSTPNYMDRMVRLTLDGEPVLMGPNSLPWTKLTFGSAPSSSEDLRLEDYSVELRDATNNRNVEISLDITLTNKAYELIVGKMFTLRMYNLGEAWDSDKDIPIKIKPDGTIDYKQYGEWKTINYSWVPVITPQHYNCDGQYIDRDIIGYIRFEGITLPGMILRFISVFEDGSLVNKKECIQNVRGAALIE